jgi:sporulation protein YlmC with PRC-barrel domain
MKLIMKHAAVPLGVSLVFLFVYAGGARQAAAGKQEKPSGYEENHTVTTAEPPGSIGVTATESMDFQLLDSKGRVLGRIHDLLCDLASGDVSFIIFDLKEPDLSRKGYYPVPSDLLGFDQSNRSYVIDIGSVDAFKYDNTIGGKISPGAFIQSDIDFQQIQMYWRNEGVMPPAGSTKRLSVSKEAGIYPFGFRILPGGNVSFRGIKGYDVINPTGQKIGEIENLLYNPFSHKIDYLFVRFEDTADKNQVYPLPLDAFTLNFRDRTITFDLAQDLLISAPSVSAGQWEKATNPDWIDQARKYWSATSPAATLRGGMHIIPQTVMRETSLLGTEVINFQGAFLGRIRDFVISDNGNIPYAITKVDDRWCFIPTTAITIDRFYKLALVDIPKSKLAALASYEPGALPDLNISDWDVEIRRFWLSEMGLKANKTAPNLIISETPAMTAKRTQNFLASALMEYTVRGSDGQILGDIKDLMLNMEEADAAYIVIGVGGFLDIGEKLFQIPVTAVSIMTGKDVVLNINRKMLDQAPGFSGNEWMTMESPEQLKRVSDYWKNILG